jgi:hypothetical protein
VSGTVAKEIQSSQRYGASMLPPHWHPNCRCRPSESGCARASESADAQRIKFSSAPSIEMDEETRERKREEIRRRLAAYKAAEAAAASGTPSAAAAAAGPSSSSGAQDAQDPGHRSVPLQSNAEANLVAAAGAQRKSAEDIKSESAQDFLCALIKAIKFANPSWGLKKVSAACDASLCCAQASDGSVTMCLMTAWLCLAGSTQFTHPGSSNASTCGLGKSDSRATQAASAPKPALRAGVAVFLLPHEPRD